MDKIHGNTMILVGIYPKTILILWCMSKNMINEQTSRNFQKPGINMRNVKKNMVLPL